MYYDVSVSEDAGPGFCRRQHGEMCNFGMRMQRVHLVSGESARAFGIRRRLLDAWSRQMLLLAHVSEVLRPACRRCAADSEAAVQRGSHLRSRPRQGREEGTAQSDKGQAERRGSRRG